VSLKPHRHYGYHASVAYFSVAIVLTPVGLTVPFAIAVRDVLNFVGIAAAIASMRHMKGALCEECISSMQLNAQEEADRAKRRLRFAHFLTESRAREVASIAVASALCGAAIITPITSGYYSVPYLIAHELFFVVMLVGTVAFHTHTKYGPWCPYCEDDDWDDEDSPAGSPDPSIPQPA
jgi:hypothetical protein